MSNEARERFIGGIGSVEFDWDALYDRLGENVPDGLDTKEKAEIMRRIVMSLVEGNPGVLKTKGWHGRGRKVPTAADIGRRTLAMAYLLRVPVDGRQSLAGLAKIGGCSKQALGKAVKKIRSEILGKFHVN
jgi:hypothetical protein